MSLWLVWSSLCKQDSLELKEKIYSSLPPVFWDLRCVSQRLARKQYNNFFNIHTLISPMFNEPILHAGHCSGDEPVNGTRLILHS